MIVYRMENQDGKGPYNTLSEIGQKLMNTHCGDARRPAPDGDFKPSVNYDHDSHAFACPSPELLKGWFEGFMTRLRANGFTMYAYKVPRRYVWISKSGLQLVFNRKKAKRIS